MKPLSILLMVLLAACNSHSVKQTDHIASHSQQTKQPLRPLALQDGKFFSGQGKQLLYGGPCDSDHFDVSNLELKKEQFHYGLGREAFPALLQPAFISVAEADRLWPNNARFLVAHAGDEVKAYAVQDLIRHEVVNDELNGHPIMAAYCILADLGAVYKRQYGDEVLTFALSGYTYYDPAIWNGLDAFVLWDRETESLWWPLVEKAVSGPLKGVRLQELDKAHWEDTSWKEVKKRYPQAQVLQSGQDFERPTNWPKSVDIPYLLANFRSGK
ncbi:DUF3179 domain-containing (seleno)protein [Pontibacter sp. CAU 1760]